MASNTKGPTALLQNPQALLLVHADHEVPVSYIIDGHYLARPSPTSSFMITVVNDSYHLFELTVAS